MMIDAYRFTFTVSAPPPPPAAATLLHFDGADASTVFTDSAAASKVWNRTGAGIEIDTAQSKFEGRRAFSRTTRPPI